MSTSPRALHKPTSRFARTSSYPGDVTPAAAATAVLLIQTDFSRYHGTPGTLGELFHQLWTTDHVNPAHPKATLYKQICCSRGQMNKQYYYHKCQAYDDYAGFSIGFSEMETSLSQVMRSLTDAPGWASPLPNLLCHTLDTYSEHVDGLLL